MKKIAKIILLSITIVVVFISCTKKDAQAESEGFTLRTGVNVSHWLSQNINRGVEREKYIVKADFDSIRAMGFDHIRLPIDEEHMWDTLGNKEPEAFKLMHNAIKWAFEANLKVIIDLHIIRSNLFFAENNTMWEDPKEQKKFVNMWLDLSKELKGYPTDKLAYEIMSEVFAENHEDWNELISDVVKALRVEEPSRKIVIGSNMWHIAKTFPFLKIPENDKNIILSFHCFTPNALTYHTAPWNPIAEYSGPVNYPGWTVDTNEYKNMSPKVASAMRNFANGYYDKQTLAKSMMPAIKYAKEKGLQLYCGEFGIYPHIDEEIMLRWYKDVCSIFKENNIPYCHWCYKGDFPVVKEDGIRYKKLTEILTAK